jgi:pyruvate/2-oxoglutarate dehydrogenase complex dihydrolipoamide dehydrogenase (E3) component
MEETGARLFRGVGRLADLKTVEVAGEQLIARRVVVIANGSTAVTTLTELLRETEERHGGYEATAPKHHWSEWYAAYMGARERGRTPADAAADAAGDVERSRTALRP